MIPQGVKGKPGREVSVVPTGWLGLVEASGFLPGRLAIARLASPAEIRVQFGNDALEFLNDPVGSC